MASGFQITQDISTLFKHVTSASEIAEEFKMFWTTLIYINNLALASYFKELLYSEIKISHWFVILLDKNMNKITQQRQLDYSVRFWNKKNQLMVAI